MRVRAAAAVAALALAGVAAGCGGGDGGGDRLTKDEYIAQADAICKAANEKIDALGEPETMEEIATLAADAIEIQEGSLAELRALKPPEEDEATLNEAYALVEQQVEVGKKVKAAAEAGDLEAIQTLIAENEPLDDQADKIAADYGLTELAVAGCGGSGGGDRLTKEEYIAQADAICKAANEKIDALGEPETMEEIATLAADAIEIQTKSLADLRALKPPEADEAKLNEAYALIDQQVGLGKEILEAAKAGDLEKIQKILAEGKPIDDQAGAIAADYGLKECGGD
ncbi:MAG: hypothetical protein KJ051_10335 [Thermoleophilia bacterium]|nr:hypothetical protein [Thermoleophilia bacterium]